MKPPGITLAVASLLTGMTLLAACGGGDTDDGRGDVATEAAVDGGLGDGGDAGASCPGVPSLEPCHAGSSGPVCQGVACYSLTPEDNGCLSMSGDNHYLMQRLGLPGGGSFGQCNSVKSGPHCRGKNECCYVYAHSSCN